MMRRLFDWIVPPAALQWGRLTRPPRIDFTSITVNTVAFRLAMANLDRSAAELEAQLRRVNEVMGCTTEELLERLHANVAEFRDRRNSNWRSTGP